MGCCPLRNRNLAFCVLRLTPQSPSKRIEEPPFTSEGASKHLRRPSKHISRMPYTSTGAVKRLAPAHLPPLCPASHCSSDDSDASDWLPMDNPLFLPDTRVPSKPASPSAPYRPPADVAWPGLLARWAHLLSSFHSALPGSADIAWRGGGEEGERESERGSEGVLEELVVLLQQLVSLDFLPPTLLYPPDADEEGERGGLEEDEEDEERGNEGRGHAGEDQQGADGGPGRMRRRKKKGPSAADVSREWVVISLASLRFAYLGLLCDRLAHVGGQDSCPEALLGQLEALSLMSGQQQEQGQAQQDPWGRSDGSAGTTRKGGQIASKPGSSSRPARPSGRDLLVVVLKALLHAPHMAGEGTGGGDGWDEMPVPFLHCLSSLVAAASSPPPSPPSASLPSDSSPATKHAGKDAPVLKQGSGVQRRRKQSARGMPGFDGLAEGGGREGCEGEEEEEEGGVEHQQNGYGGEQSQEEQEEEREHWRLQRLQHLQQEAEEARKRHVVLARNVWGAVNSLLPSIADVIPLAAATADASAGWCALRRVVGFHTSVLDRVTSDHATHSCQITMPHILHIFPWAGILRSACQLLNTRGQGTKAVMH